MRDLVLLLKSYAGDLDLATRLISSFNAHNPDRLPMVIVVPDADLPGFMPFASDTIEVIGESRFAEHLVDHEVAGIRPGYINQEIVKLAFWEAGYAENTFPVDSDAVFVRDIHRSDFMFDATMPYTVLVEDNELKVEPRYYNEHWVGREQQLRTIQQLVGLDDPRLLTCHGHQVLSSTVLRSLRDDFLAPRGWTYADMLAQAPYEFSWYNFWLQKSQVIPIHAREPLVKVFHHEGQALEYALRGITLDDIARGYLAIVVNANYARSFGALEIEPLSRTLARQVSLSDLIDAIREKARLFGPGRGGS